jgi:general secretion pathway protein A
LQWSLTFLDWSDFGSANTLPSMNFLAHWQLRERPFEATWDTRFFFASTEHEEAVNRLLYLVGETSMNIGMLSGDIGCGKTLTRAVFSERLTRNRFCIVTLENSGFSSGDLLAAILHKLEPLVTTRGRTKLDRYEQFENILQQLSEAGRHLVLLLDEAQDIPPLSLHELRWLTNFNSGGCARMTLILIGQPELRGKVAADRAINQRISLRFHLKPLRREEVHSYLEHRLRTAGHQTGKLFDPPAAEALFDSTKGVPREVNRLVKLSLEHAWLHETEGVSQASISAVVTDLEKHQALPVT